MISTPPPLLDADTQAASDILGTVDPSHGFAVFSRLPAQFTWWMRSVGSTVTGHGLGAAMHEVTHAIDNTLQFTCFNDGRARYFADGVIHQIGLTVGGTSNYHIAAEAVPAALKVSRPRFDAYITGASAYSGNDFRVLLDELNAYTGVANFEVNLLESPKYSYLATNGDLNVGGMVDFMLFTQAYLQAARLNHPATYAAIQTDTSTVTYLIFAWARAERILAAAYPYSVAAGGTQVVPLDVLAAVYSPALLDELDRLGISHRTAADWSATYLR
ncbi:MAG: hypothetical protein V4750_02045 [Pseudomonadota bacterium]